ncbi:MAG: carboxypeptidase regulatory-like domain-containing protein [Myxococcales bacterium]|nr:carboxypeptidase regulatory-like domain-containing protein [Myxococcales bacterium]
MRRTSVGKWVLVGVLAASATAFAGTLRGTVRMADPADTPADESPPYYWSVWNGLVDPVDPKASPSRELAVILTGGPGGDPVGCEHGLRGGGFMSRTMAVKAGGTLRLVNTDGCSHELYSDTIPDFAPLATAPGNPRNVVVPAGVHEIHDRLYAHVHGVVHALPDLAACGRIADDGAFVFEGVPAGSYTLKVLQGAREVHSAAVTLTDGETTVEPIAVDN